MDDASTEADLGPKMRACSERERKFVWAILDRPTATRRVWAKLAGFGAENQTPLSLRVTGHTVFHRQRVQDALEEETRRQVKLGGAIGVAGLMRIAAAPKHKGYQKACETLAAMGGFGPQQQISVAHTHTDMTGKAMEERIRALAAKHGMDPALLLGGNAAPAMKLIEGTAVEVRDE